MAPRLSEELKLGNGQWNFPILRHLLDEVLPKSSPVWDFEMSHTFPAIGSKTMRLNARKLTGNGQILLSIRDITDFRNALRWRPKGDGPSKISSWPCDAGDETGRMCGGSHTNSRVTLDHKDI